MTVVLTGTDLRYEIGDRPIFDGISVRQFS